MLYANVNTRRGGRYERLGIKTDNEDQKASHDNREDDNNHTESSVEGDNILEGGIISKNTIIGDRELGKEKQWVQGERDVIVNEGDNSLNIGGDVGGGVNVISECETIIDNN
ncbi:hypothetical protein ACOSQ3_029164 [Xanthoceras sorbifolium]